MCLKVFRIDEAAHQSGNYLAGGAKMLGHLLLYHAQQAIGGSPRDDQIGQALFELAGMNVLQLRHQAENHRGETLNNNVPDGWFNLKKMVLRGFLWNSPIWMGFSPPSWLDISSIAFWINELE